jgi:hypothetical protein
VDEVRDLDGRLPAERRIAGPGPDPRELRDPSKPHVVSERTEAQPHEAGGNASGRPGEGRHQYRIARTFGLPSPRKKRGDIGDVDATTVIQSGASAPRARSEPTRSSRLGSSTHSRASARVALT